MRGIKSSKIKELLFSAGSEAVGSNPEEFQTAIKSEMQRLGKIIKNNGIRGE